MISYLDSIFPYINHMKRNPSTPIIIYLLKIIEKQDKELQSQAEIIVKYMNRTTHNYILPTDNKEN